MRLPRLLKALFWSQRGLFLWIGLLLAIVSAWCVFQRQAISRYLDSLDRRDDHKAKVRTLQAEVNRLEREKGVLTRGGFEHEQVARDRYRYSKPGEEVLLLEPPPADDASTTPRLSLPGGLFSRRD